MKVDVRERNVIAELELMGVTHEVEQLPVADFVIGDLGVERKTWGDLVASVSDGRYREQLQRLKEAFPRVLYVVEGMSPRADDPAYSRGRLVILSLATRHGVGVVRTRDPRETALTLSDLVRREAAQGGGGAGRGPVVGEVKVRRSDRVTPHTCFVAQLCQVPGLARGFADRLAETLGSMRALVADLEAGGEKAVGVLGRGKRLKSLREHLGFSDEAPSKS